MLNWAITFLVIALIAVLGPEAVSQARPLRSHGSCLWSS